MGKVVKLEPTAKGESRPGGVRRRGRRRGTAGARPTRRAGAPQDRARARRRRLHRRGLRDRRAAGARSARDEQHGQPVRRLCRHLAGSFIAALCANGVTPEEMMRVVTRQGARRSATSISATCCTRTCSSSRARARCCRCGRSRSPPGGRPARAGLGDGPAARARRGAALRRVHRRRDREYLHRVLSEPGRTDDSPSSPASCT